MHRSARWNPNPANGGPLFLSLSGLLLMQGCVGFDGWPPPVEPSTAVEPTPAGGLSGQVLDATNGLSLAGATITVDPSGTEAVSGFDGDWSIPRVAPGSYTIVAAAEGFEPVRTEPVVVDSGSDVLVDILLGRLLPSPRDGVLHVMVTAPNGGPAVGATLSMVGNGVVVEGVADGQGEAHLRGLGGQTVVLTVDLPGTPVVARSVEGIEVPALGGTELALTLSGRGGHDDHTIGSQVCSYCHPAIGAQWAETAHARALSGIEGPMASAFDTGLVVTLGDGLAELGRTVDGSARVVLQDASGARDTWVVAGVIGGSRRGAVPWAERDGAGWPLPVAWVVPDASRPGLREEGWLPGELGPWFEADGTFAYLDTPQPNHSAEAACFACHVTGTVLEVDGGAVTMRGLATPSARWDEGDVGCEACHGAGETHTSGPLSEKRGSVVMPDALGADGANDVCGRCHGAVEGDHGLPFAWTEADGLLRPGDTLAGQVGSSFVAWPSGAAAVPGAQLDELRASAHGAEGWNARCTDCHDPHGSSLRADLRLSAEDDTLCQTCHLGLSFSGDPVLAALHTGHDGPPEAPPGSGRCVGCHQPETAARLLWSEVTGAGDLGSHGLVAVPPSDSIASFDLASASMLPSGEFAPNACQVCHVWNDLTGDPLLRATHVELQQAFIGMFP